LLLHQRLTVCLNHFGEEVIWPRKCDAGLLTPGSRFRHGFQGDVVENDFTLQVVVDVDVLVVPTGGCSTGRRAGQLLVER